MRKFHKVGQKESWKEKEERKEGRREGRKERRKEGRKERRKEKNGVMKFWITRGTVKILKTFIFFKKCLLLNKQQKQITDKRQSENRVPSVFSNMPLEDKIPSTF